MRNNNVIENLPRFLKLGLFCLADEKAKNLMPAKLETRSVSRCSERVESLKEELEMFISFSFILSFQFSAMGDVLVSKHFNCIFEVCIFEVF